jgi:cobalt-zinc-cadmium efflux system protein
VSGHSPSARYSYGYKRFALLGALINATVLLLGSVFVIYASVMRIIEPQYVKVEGMFLLAILGVIINGVAVWRTHKSSGINERIVSLHLLEDVLGWIAVLIASVVMMFVEVPILDPILSIGISVFVLYNVVRNLIATFNVILQGVPSDIKLIELQKKVEQLEAVISVHDLHVWSLDSQYNIASLHAVISPEMTLDQMAQLKQEIKLLMLAEQIEHTTVEFETEQEECHPCDAHL